MGLLDYFDPGRLKAGLQGLLGRAPIVKALHGEKGRSFKQALLDMPIGDAEGAYEAALNVGPMMLGKIVYHGSPHKFDKFDFAGNIGRGEGAQAYGHGGYFADAMGVAKTYADMAPAKVVFDGGEFVGKMGTEAYGDAATKAWNEVVAAHGGQHQNPFATAKERLGGKYGPRNKTDEEAIKIIEGWQRKNARVESGGFLYESDLPDEWIPKMLDWDNNITEEMRKQISQPMIEKFGSGASGGQGLNQWKQVVWEFKNAGSKQPEVDAANFLREQGITGIRYLDGGSRGKGQGSYNYVVFPGLEDQVKILERNGVPINRLAEIVK